MQQTVSAEAASQIKGLEMRWVDFKDYAQEIYALRKEVFVDGQGFDDFVLRSAKDETGLHLVAFHNSKPVAAICAYISQPNDAIFEQLQLPAADKIVVQFARRVTLPEYRELRLSELMGLVMWKSVYESLDTAYFFIGLMGIHQKLAPYYERYFGFEPHHELESANGNIKVSIGQGENLKRIYNKTKGNIEVIGTFLNIEAPSLNRFLDDHEGYKDLRIKMTDENLYLKPLSFKDELPRLSAQARLVYGTQVQVIDQINFPKAPASFLDVGCGPGVYLSLFSHHPKVEGYQFHGLDLSADMVAYAKFSFRKTQWKQGNIYDTQYPDASFDVIHTSFVFIHLTNPELALKELYRILKPGGLLYVVDVNDDTFEGPSVVKRLIHKHKQVYEGKRDIMNHLPALAKDYDFLLEQEFAITVTNTGNEGETIQEIGKLQLGRISMWAMFSFISQRHDMLSYYERAEEHYLRTLCQISIQLQSKVFRKAI
jgi:ubiquinone/menaquinone biosynthesis C-methylase UbiE